MRIILKIAKTELSVLFYSPVAWLIMIAFMCNVSIVYMDIFSSILRMPFTGFAISQSVTAMMLTGEHGLFEVIQNTLFMYIPLLTMNVMSREYHSGSIKLLYSSPIRSSQIVMGKYSALIVCSLIFAFILAIPIIVIAFTVPAADYSLAFSGLFGLLLLALTYSAIGLFMSSITSYQVVAAVTTLAALAFLRFVGSVGQSVDFVREITYWLSMNGRTSNMVNGLICSKDVIYFVLVIALFLSFSILKINHEKRSKSKLHNMSQYLMLFIGVIALGYVSSLTPLQLHYDATQNKSNTITETSIDLLDKLEGELKITTYANIFDDDFKYGAPKNMMADKSLFDKYKRFKSDITMDYVYYYNEPSDPHFMKAHEGKSFKEIALSYAGTREFDPKLLISYEDVLKLHDVDEEEGRFFRVLEANGKKAILRLYRDWDHHPSEREIAATLKQLSSDNVTIGVVTSKGGRDPKGKGDKDYHTLISKREFRSSLINQGYKYSTININETKEIADNVNLLILADINEELTEGELNTLSNYIAKGGNLMVLTDCDRQKTMNPVLSILGLEALEGVLVQNVSRNLPADVVQSIGLKEYISLMSDSYYPNNTSATLHGAVALTTTEDKHGFEITPILKTQATGVWIEKESRDLTTPPVLNSAAGEEEKSYTTGYALTRTIKGKEQRVIVLGDADCYGNINLISENGKTNFRNFYNAVNNVSWLNSNEYPVKIASKRDSDLKIDIKARGFIQLKRVMFYGLTALAILLATLVLRKRQKN